jgi:hypothetical protein
MLLTEIRTDAEYEFLKLWHSCEWMKWDRYPESVFMILEGEVLFEQDWKSNYLYCKYANVWHLFESEFGYNYMQINNMISGIMEENLKAGVLTPILSDDGYMVTLEEELKNKVLTPHYISFSSLTTLEDHLKKGVLTPRTFCVNDPWILENRLKNRVSIPSVEVVEVVSVQLEDHFKNGGAERMKRRRKQKGI